ncbi:MAG: hypothetical protein D6725_05615 [Planctomycetota bacterium]|nr:MAG: hypothetical protein D6725_05615 [Planctomycetota bacterium]
MVFATAPVSIPKRYSFRLRRADHRYRRTRRPVRDRSFAARHDGRTSPGRSRSRNSTIRFLEDMTMATKKRVDWYYHRNG